MYRLLPPNERIKSCVSFAFHGEHGQVHSRRPPSVRSSSTQRSSWSISRCSLSFSRYAAFLGEGELLGELTKLSLASAAPDAGRVRTGRENEMDVLGAQGSVHRARALVVGRGPVVVEYQRHPLRYVAKLVHKQAATGRQADDLAGATLNAAITEPPNSFLA